ncbi:MAG TPA: DUF1127 domain-containing protein [Nitrospiraceae bacterium]|nr:DUF1127 domain-containing protein [Nitrospiraceae bacterium]
MKTSRLLQVLVRRAIARLAHELSVRRTARHLAQLDNRMLQDIGLRRTGSQYFMHRDGDLLSLIVRSPRPRTAWVEVNDLGMPLRENPQPMERPA